MVYLQPIYKKMRDNYNKNQASNIKSILSEIGENTERDGLLKTPERVAKSMRFLTNGYDKDPSEILKSAMFAEDYSQMVLVKDIELYSLCEHHMCIFAFADPGSIGEAHPRDRWLSWSGAPSGARRPRSRGPSCSRGT